MNMRMSKSFIVNYGGKFCIICGFDIDSGDEGCFVEDEIAHFDCAEKKYSYKKVYIPEFTFDPGEWSK